MKSPITWLELLKEKLNYLKKTTGKSVSVGEVAGEAKKEWVQIKEGKHPKYIQGKQQKNKSKNKTKKNTAASSREHKKTESSHKHTSSHKHANEDAIMKKIITGCPKCMKKYNKLMKKTKKNKKYKGGDEEEDINTDIFIKGGSSDNAAVEDELIKNSVVDTDKDTGVEEAAAEGGAAEGVDKAEAGADKAGADKAGADKAGTEVSETEQKGGKKKRRNNKK